MSSGAKQTTADVWFGPGSSSRACLEVNDPMLMRCVPEGSDQHRGCSILPCWTAVATTSANHGPTCIDSRRFSCLVWRSQTSKRRYQWFQATSPMCCWCNAPRASSAVDYRSRRTFVQRHRKTIIRSIPVRSATHSALLATDDFNQILIKRVYADMSEFDKWVQKKQQLLDAYENYEFLHVVPCNL